ncbi:MULTISPECIES: hypothetical protein [Paenibacillus]|uniref:hypothetical protein n=1 Tax=Paenibacillus TaxID=44249 RepID=UPI0011A63A93|nr:hypothetical protein [Paenibacillus sp. IHBB 10380]
MSNPKDLQINIERLKTDLSENFPNIQAEIERSQTQLMEAQKAIRKEKDDKIQRDKETNELLTALVSIAQEKPEIIQHVQTLIQHSTVQNVQSNANGSYGVQNITNNNGLNVEDFLKLIGEIRDVSSVLNPETAEEVDEVVEELEKEVKNENPKKGIIKASLSYFKNLFHEIIVEPSKSIAKAQYSAFAQEKAKSIIDGIEELINNSL